MGSGLPLLNCLWQQALRSFCSLDSPGSSKWVYAVFWRILPRNYPPPRWDDAQGDFDRSNANRRNWILVWEDGFCDFCECERTVDDFGQKKFVPGIFFKMSHEVYNYGEGLIGKVAAENGHKWVFWEIQPETEPNISSWNRCLDSQQPKAWDFQFNSGIQTIAIVAVREGVIQLGSMHKVVEDLNLVISIRRKFNDLQSIPGIFALQRPLPAPSEHHTNALRQKLQASEMLRCGLRLSYDKEEEIPSKFNHLGSNSSQTNNFIHSNTPILPPVSYSLGMILSRLPCVAPSNSHVQSLSSANNNDFQGPNFFGSLDQISSVKQQIVESRSKLIGPCSSQSCEDTAIVMHSDFHVQGEEQSDAINLL